jgi:CubicO group peptidase (beta-lactamase class C family)
MLHYRWSSGNRRNANHTGLSMTSKSIVTVLLAFAGMPFVAAGQLVLSASPVLAQLPASARRPAFATVVDSLVPHALAEFLVPGAAVALIRGGTVVWMRGYGFADRASGRHVTPQTTFNIGSMSKSVTSWGALHLVEEGRLELDRPVDSYLTRWHLPTSQYDNAGVTVRRLLSHTAGTSLPSVTPFRSSAAVPSLEDLLTGSVTGSGGVRVILPPGTKFQYSGGGYDVLQLLVEERSGRAFGAYMRSAVLQPLRMTHSAFGWPPEIAAAAATPYNSLGQPAAPERFTEVAAAGLQTTVADFARLAAAELAGPKGERPGRGVLSPDLVRLMHTPTPPSKEWGLGHEVLRDSATGLTFVGHNGANTGFRAIFQVAPATGDGLVVLTNSSNGFPVLQRVTCAWQHAAGARSGTRYCDPPDVRYALYAPYLAGGVKQLLAGYESLRGDAEDRYAFDATQLVSLAYDILHAGRTADALAVFEANVDRYPNDWNSHDSLGEAYLADGDTARAVAHYRRSVELNPNNRNGIEVLRRLGRAP